MGEDKENCDGTGRGSGAVGVCPSITWSGSGSEGGGAIGALRHNQHVPVLYGGRSHPSQPREFSEALTPPRRACPGPCTGDTCDYGLSRSWPMQAGLVLRVGNPK